MSMMMNRMKRQGSIAQMGQIELDQFLEKTTKSNEKSFEKAVERHTGKSSMPQDRAKWLESREILQGLMDEAGVANLDAPERRVELPLSSFVSMLHSSVKKAEDSPIAPFNISRMSLKGEAVKRRVLFEAELEITVARSEWTVVPLFSKTVAVTESSVSHKEVSATEEFDCGVISVLEPGYCLVCCSAGTYNVALKFMCNYVNKSETGVVVHMPLTVIGTLDFKVPEEEIQVLVEPALRTVLTPLPNEKSTLSHCELSPGTILNVQWTHRVEEEEVEVAELSFTSEQLSLFSLGEGVLSGHTHFDFKVTSGALSLVEILVETDVKVLGVDGMNVKKWDVRPQAGKAADDGEKKGKDKIEEQEERMEEETKEHKPKKEKERTSRRRDASGKPRTRKPKEKKVEQGEPEATRKEPEFNVLRVLLEYGLEDFYTLTVLTEREVGTVEWDIPQFFVRAAEREKGFVAIEAKTSIEIEELEAEGLAHVDLGELPSKLSELSRSAILLAYKFISPRIWLRLAVTKHADVAVLVASIDAAHVMATYTEEGSLLTKVICSVRNTQKQYTRVTIPEGSEVWSAVCAESPVKPAMDADGKILIPLHKSSKGESTFILSLVTRMRLKAMEKSGRCGVAFPSFDMPINKLYVSLFLPKNFRYGEFDGDIMEVKFFSGVPPHDGMVRAPPKKKLANMSVYGKVRKKKEVTKPSGLMRVKAAAGSSVGSVPVTISIPRIGSHFMFEQLVVLQRSMELSVSYRRKTKNWFQKRTL